MNSTHTPVEDSSHTIELDRLEVVIQAILDLVEMACQKEINDGKPGESYALTWV